MNGRKERQRSGAIIAFDSTKDLLEHIARSAQKMAEVPMKAWQRDLKPGDYFMSEVNMCGQDIDIYGEIIESTYQEDREMLADRPELRLCKCYSQACPNGELGTVYVVTMTRPITCEEFETAKGAGWPTAQN